MRAYAPRRKRPSPDPFATLPVTIVFAFTMLAMLVALVGTVLVAGSWGDAAWSAGAHLFYFSGGVLLVNGLLCAFLPLMSQRIWGAGEGGVGLFVAAVGLAMLGGALEHDFGSAPCLVLVAPFGVSIAWSGIWMHRRPATDRHEPMPAVFAVGYVLLGLAVVAFGLLDFFE